MKRKLIAIVGPTASGKTAVGVKLAKALNGEIVSADSRQIFRGLDLGTGKDLAEYNGVKYHLIDILDPGEEFSMFKWLKMACEKIEGIFAQGKVPIVVGGTGLYIQALLEGFDFNSEAKAANQGQEYSRESLEKLSLEELRKILKNNDQIAYEKIDLHNPHRIIRAIEKAQAGVRPAKTKPDFEVLEIVIDLPRDELYARIDQRAEDRFEVGMLEEVVGLLNAGVSHEWMVKLGLEYRIMTNFLINNTKYLTSGSISDSEVLTIKQSREFDMMKQELKWKSHQYARRQLTWFRRFPEIIWERDYEKIELLAKSFLDDLA